MTHTLQRFGWLTCLVAATLTLTCEPVRDYCRPTGAHYDPACEFCFAGKAYPLCGNGDYNPLTEVCTERENLRGTRCADETYVLRGTPCGGYALSLGVAPAGGGGVEGAPLGKTSIVAGDPVTLYAQPAEGYRFVGWVGSENTQSQSLPLTMDANKSLIAMFSFGDAVTLVAAAFPRDAGTVSIANGAAGSEVTAEYGEGDAVTVHAEELPGYAFDSWSGSGGFESRSPTISVTMNDSRTLVAMFKPNVYTFTVNANPEDGGTVFVDGGALSGTSNQDAGARIEAIAHPAEGYEFSGWTGAAGGSNNPVAISVTSSGMTLTANFRKQSGGGPTAPTAYYELTTNASPSNGGSVERSPEQTRYGAGTEVTVTATPSGGYTFANWTGPSGTTFGNAGSANTTVTVNSNLVITANFQQQQTTGTYSGPTVTVGGLTWTAKNLDVDTDSSWCYDDSPDSCAKYGRLYAWNAAKTACQSVGGRLPTQDEWYSLLEDAEVGGVRNNSYSYVVYDYAGTALKSESGWYDNGNGTDKVGFSALPGGDRRDYDGSFLNAGRVGFWWGATEYGAGIADHRTMAYNLDYVYEYYGDADNKSYGFSVRCVGVVED